MTSAKNDILFSEDDVLKLWLERSVLNFTLYAFKELYHHGFIIGQHHRAIAEKLDRVLNGQCTRLIINMPPRYGKTELAVKNFIALGFAKNPRSKFIHLSYSDDLTRDNSRGVQEILRSETFSRLYPDCTPNTVNTHKWSNKAGGVLYAVSTAGQVTGFGAGLVQAEDGETADEITQLDRETENNTFGGAIVIDDPLKPEDALSDMVREKINQRFETTIRNRVNSRNTPIVIIMQRLHENDLCGYLQEAEPGRWETLSLPVIQENKEGDPEALWPHKHTLEELYRLRELNPFVFETQYMQNPRPLEGLMYEREFRTYDALPITRKQIIKAYIDTADTGADYLCCIIYAETDIANFLLDVYLTQKPMEVTEGETARRLTQHRVDVANVESNNGGRGFARNVEKNLRLLGNNHTRVAWFTQRENKDTRIFSHSAEVQNLTFMPTGWAHIWPDFYRAITQYRKSGKNAHDDAPDALTGTIEKRKEQRGSAAGFF